MELQTFCFHLKHSEEKLRFTAQLCEPRGRGGAARDVALHAKCRTGLSVPTIRKSSGKAVIFAPSSPSTIFHFDVWPYVGTALGCPEGLMDDGRDLFHVGSRAAWPPGAPRRRVCATPRLSIPTSPLVTNAIGCSPASSAQVSKDESAPTSLNPRLPGARAL